MLIAEPFRAQAGKVLGNIPPPLSALSVYSAFTP